MLKKMRILSDQRGIMERYLAEGDGWNPHLMRTRGFILESVQETLPKRLLVCGSGWLLDVPLQELKGICSEIILADICHPVQVRKQISSMEGCRLLSIDLTGGAVEGTYRFIREYRKSGRRESLSSIPAGLPELPFSPDYIVSANMLNQMDILLVDYIKRFLQPEQKELAAFRKRIQQNHLNFLKTTPHCLVTDTEEILLDGSGQEKARKKLIHVPLPPSRASDSWIWEFDEGGYYNRGMRTHLLVRAFRH